MKKSYLCLPEHFTLHATALINLIHRDRGMLPQGERPRQLEQMRKHRCSFLLDESAMPQPHARLDISTKP